MALRLPHFLGQHHIIGGTVILALTQLGASAMGFVRDATFTRTLSPDITDVYFAAFRPSDFLFQTCIMAALGTVLVPVLASYKAHEKKEEIDRVLSGSMFLGSIVFGIITILMGILLPWIAPHLVEFDGEKMHLYIQFGRIALFSNFLFVFGNTLGQYLITTQKYWIYGITPIIYTLGTILGALFLTPVFGEYGPIIGTVCGTLIYTVLRYWGAYRIGFQVRKTLWHPDFPQMGSLMLPRVLSLGALQFQLIMFDRVASTLDPGSVTINAFARNFQSVLVGVTGIALAQSAYSLLGQSAAWKNEVLFKKYMRWGISALLVITIPGSILLILCSPIFAKILGVADVPLFSKALFAYAFSIPFESMNHLMLRAYYATKHTLLPAIATVAAAIVASVMSHMFVQKYALQSIGIGYTAGQITLLLILGISFGMVLTRVRKV
jgi:putative peptidoglycan lipid II flippase